MLYCETLTPSLFGETEADSELGGVVTIMEVW